MKIKIIDLLNKKANGEKLPKIIIIDGEKYYLQNVTDLEDLYINAGNSSWTRTEHIILNDKIEIIEEPNKIEKLDEILRIDDLQPPYNENIQKIWENIIIQQNKLKEIIDYINKDDKNE